MTLGLNGPKGRHVAVKAVAPLIQVLTDARGNERELY